jgi:hypothetical protein
LSQVARVLLADPSRDLKQDLNQIVLCRDVRDAQRS